MASQTRPARRKITIERTVNADIQAVWDLWTTSQGLESWWGPEGFAVSVHGLDLCPGGELTYVMKAIAPEQIEFMKKAGMPVATEARVTYTEVIPLRRLAFTQMADFIPGVEPYEVATAVDFEARQGSVRMILTIDAMHDEQWTKMAVMGWESELGKLAKQLG